MNIEVRQPVRAQKTRYGIVDCDIHPKMLLEDLRPYLSNQWWSADATTTDSTNTAAGPPAAFSGGCRSRRCRSASSGRGPADGLRCSSRLLHRGSNVEPIIGRQRILHQYLAPQALRDAFRQGHVAVE